MTDPKVQEILDAAQKKSGAATEDKDPYAKARRDVGSLLDTLGEAHASGQIVGAVVVVVGPDSRARFNVTGMVGGLDMLGAMETAKHQITAALLQS